MADAIDPTEMTQDLIHRLNAGSNWVERRDAATALTLTARLAILALRQTAEDADPDVSHECKKAAASIQSDLQANPGDSEAELEAAVRAYRADPRVASPDRGTEDAASKPAARHQTVTGSDLERWLAEIAGRRGDDLRKSGSQWAIEFRLDGDRKQTVFVDPERKDSSGQPVVLMYTLCGPAEPKVYMASLQANAQLSHAAFALIGQGEGRKLVLVGRRRIADLTRETLAETLEYLAKKGDRAEAQLQAQDEH